MIKIALGISLLLNFTLTYFVLNKKTEKEIIERVIIETHSEGKKEGHNLSKSMDFKETAHPREEKQKKKKKKSQNITTLEPYEFQDSVERMETDRMDFLSEKLGMSEEKIAEHNKIRDEFSLKLSNQWGQNLFQEPSFQERRKMISLEEEFHSKLEKLHGKKNWQRYQKYREKYNQDGFKRQMEDNQPFIFMGL